jgi:uncharacterized membrane protein (UPF0136 family)
MFCSKCGSQIKDGYKFCPKCGNPLNSLKKQIPLKERKKGEGSRWLVVKMGIGVCFILATIILLAFSKYDINKDWRYWPIILSSIGLMCPFSILNKQKLTDDEKLIMYSSAALSLVVAFVFALIKKGNQEDFWTELFYALTTIGMYYFYIALLVLSSLIAIWNRKWGIILAAVIAGILIPVALFSLLEILITIIIVIGIIIYICKDFFSSSNFEGGSSADFGSGPSLGGGDMN